MKAFHAFCCAILVAGLSFAVVPPPCTTFDDQQLDGWTFQNGSGTAQPGHGGYYADVHDAQGGSGFLSPPSYHGDWLKIVNNCGVDLFRRQHPRRRLGQYEQPGQRRVLDQGQQRPLRQLRPHAGGRGLGWHTFCAPIGPLVGGNSPSNGQGTWHWGSGNNSNWSGLLGNVIECRFSSISRRCWPRPSISRSTTSASRRIRARGRFPGQADLRGTSGDVRRCIDRRDFVELVLQSLEARRRVACRLRGPLRTPMPADLVKLGINGGINSPLCITRCDGYCAPRFRRSPGPTTTCQNPATYCVTNPQSGVVYNWSATNGTVTPATGTCTSVHWNTPAGGIIVVTATNKAGCTSTRRFEVTGCKLNPCCDKPSFKVDSWTMPYVGGNYVVTPKLTSSTPVKRVVIDILSANITYSSTARATAHAFAPAITSAYLGDLVHGVAAGAQWDGGGLERQRPPRPR